MKVYVISTLMSVILLACAAPYEPEKDEATSIASESYSYPEFSWSSGDVQYSGTGNGPIGDYSSAEEFMPNEEMVSSSSGYVVASYFNPPVIPGMSSYDVAYIDSLLKAIGGESSSDIELPTSSPVVSQSSNNTSGGETVTTGDSSQSTGGTSGGTTTDPSSNTQTPTTGGDPQSHSGTSSADGLPGVSSLFDTYADLLNTFKDDNTYLKLMEQAFLDGDDQLAETVYEYMMKEPEYLEQMQELQLNVLQDTDLITSVANAYIQNPEAIDVSNILTEQGIIDPLDQFLITQYLNVLLKN
ncbi:MAG: hypothetical protein OCC49_16905 [Fibrobacterales bacterium]